MNWQLRALSALAEHLVLCPSTHTAVDNHQKLQFQGIQSLLLDFLGTRQALNTHIYMKSNTPTHKINILRKENLSTTKNMRAPYLPNNLFEILSVVYLKFKLHWLTYFVFFSV